MSVARLAAYIVFGAIGGYGWYRLVGCSTGTCPITARWWTSTLYGAVVGGMMGSTPG